MSRSVALVSPDLSSIELVGAGGAARWAPGPVREGDETPPFVSAQQRIKEAAAWISGQRDARRRLGAVVIDVDDALCLWVRASSTAPPVVAAAVRNLAQEWGDWATAASVEPILDATPRVARRALRLRGRDADADDRAEAGSDDAPAPTTPGAFAVICQHDASVRLWLDALDKRGVRIGTVMSLWHAMALRAADDDGAGGSSQEVTASLLVEPGGRVVWAWSVGPDASSGRTGGLLAGGSLVAEPAPRRGEGSEAEGVDDAAAADARARRALQRLAMDWMSWSSQLGVTPDRLVIAGRDAEAWARAAGGMWPHVATQASETDEPIHAVVEATAQRKADPSMTARACLARVTHRPTRSVRKRYQLAAAAMLLIGIALGSVGFRLSTETSEWEARSRTLRSEAVDLVRETWDVPREERIRNASRDARAFFEQELVEARDLRLPPRPRPYHEVIGEVTRTMHEVRMATKPEELGEDQWKAQLTLLSAEIATVQMNFDVSDRSLGTAIISAIIEGVDAMNWTNQSRDPQTVRLTGSWSFD